MIGWLWIDENMKESCCGLLWGIIQAGTPTDTTQARKQHPGRNSNWAPPRHNTQTLINLFGHLLLIWWKNQQPRPQYYNYKSLHRNVLVHKYTCTVKNPTFFASKNGPKFIDMGPSYIHIYIYIYIYIHAYTHTKEKFSWWITH